MGVLKNGLFCLILCQFYLAHFSITISQLVYIIDSTILVYILAIAIRYKCQRFRLELDKFWDITFQKDISYKFIVIFMTESLYFQDAQTLTQFQLISSFLLHIIFLSFPLFISLHKFNKSRENINFHKNFIKKGKSYFKRKLIYLVKLNPIIICLVRHVKSTLKVGITVIFIFKFIILLVIDLTIFISR